MPPQPKHRQRTDYAVTVRPRIMRETGLSRLTPGYLTDLSDTKIKYGTLDTATTRNNIIKATDDFPTRRHKCRVIALTITQINTDGIHVVEIYFGTATTIPTGAQNRNLGLAVDLIRVPDLSSASTKTWARGHGPVGLANEPLSYRFLDAPSDGMSFVVEYTMER